MTGKVKWFDDQKGYGFVTGDDGTDAFVHHKDIRTKGKGRRTLEPGQAVEFEVIQSDKGPKAINVRSSQPSTINPQPSTRE